MEKAEVNKQAKVFGWIFLIWFVLIIFLYNLGNIGRFVCSTKNKSLINTLSFFDTNVMGISYLLFTKHLDTPETIVFCINQNPY